MKSVLTFLKKRQSIVLSYVIAIALLIFVSILRPGFGSWNNLQTIAIEAAIVGIAALGQTFVILTGGIDLSIPWTWNCASILLTSWSGAKDAELYWIIPAILLITFAVGMINGVGVAFLNISPVIMTLGTNVIMMGAMLGITGGAPGASSPPAIVFLANGKVLGFPMLVLFWILLIVIASVVLAYMPLGKRLYALGNSEKVTYFSGVNVKATKLIPYGICGLTAGIAGIAMTGRVGTSYFGMGDPYLFRTVAAVAIGGTSLMGGSGNYIGTVGGAFTITILTALLTAFNLPVSMQQILYGIVLLAAMLMANRKSARSIA
jgi:ribose transport system permease protein